MSASGRRSAGCGDRQLRRELGAVVLSVLARMAASAGSLSAAISARAASAPSCANHSSAIQRGCEWRSAASAGVRSGSASISGRASLAARRRTALTRPAPPRLWRLASSTDSPTAAWAGTRSMNASWKHAEPQRRQHAQARASRSAAARASRSRGRASPCAARRRRRAASPARGRAARAPPASPCSARSAYAPSSNTRRTTANARARGRRDPSPCSPHAAGRVARSEVRRLTEGHAHLGVGGADSPDFGFLAAAQFAGISRRVSRASNVRPFRRPNAQF